MTHVLCLNHGGSSIYPQKSSGEGEVVGLQDPQEAQGDKTAQMQGREKREGEGRGTSVAKCAG